MAEAPPAVEGNLLTRRIGPAPVWAWAAIVLAAAWLWAKHRANQQAANDQSAQDTATTAQAEGQAVAPQFVIENNMPAVPTTPGAGSSVPVTTPTNGGSTTVTPPGTGSKPPTGSKPKPPTGSKPKPPTTKAPIKYTVHAGDTLSSIAKKYGTTAQELFTYNTTPGVRPASTIATLKKRGPNLIYSGETILIPQK